jgi:ATP-dependent RNA helicase RhlE
MAQEINTFEDLKLNRQLLNAIADAGYEVPTPIQAKAIPLAIAGHDLFGIAQTGTGKTAAYLLPLLMKVKYAQGDDPRALILAPTRELAMQIDHELSVFGKYTDLRHAVLIGGTGMKPQLEAVEAGVDIIVATPGRFIDVYLKGVMNLKFLKTMIMDEADKMMDMGFMPQIRRILEIIPTKRQNLLFSATMPERVVKLSEEFLEFPETVEVTPQSTPVESVNQVLYEVPNFKTKINLLNHLLKDEEKFHRVMIFVKTRRNAEALFKYLDRKNDDEIRAIHANKDQNTRINAMEAFREGNVRVLVTTDVTARGIDVDDVSHVINFDIPLIYEDYVHRIGRTGRIFKVGEAISFATDTEMLHVEKIESIIRTSIPREKIPNDVTIEDTSFKESQEMAKAMDDVKKKLDPNFKGAFHEKKKRPTAKPEKEEKGKKAFKAKKNRNSLKRRSRK